MMDSYQTVAKRLEQAAKASGKSLKDLSISSGRNHAYLHQFVKRGVPRILPEDVRRTLADELGGEPDDYVDKQVKGNAPRSPIQTTRDQIIEIPLYDIRASAGAGALVYGEEVDTYQPFRESQLSRLSKSSAKSLAVITVSGDSMWETLHDGDNVLVDQTVQRVVKEGIYILEFEGELLVKRCQRNLKDKSVRIKSDNPAYDTFDVSEDEMLRVLGRVTWIGRALG